MAQMIAANRNEQVVANFIAQRVKHSLQHIRSFKRDKDSGYYYWFYQGNKMFLRIDDLRIYSRFDKMFEDYRAAHEGEEMPLTINGRLIGTVVTYNPYAYPALFLIVDFAPAMQYDPRVVLRFAQYAGMDVSKFDRSLIEVKRPEQVYDNNPTIIF